MLTGVDLRVDGRELRPSDGVAGPEAAEGVRAGEGPPESFVDAGIMGWWWTQALGVGCWVEGSWVMHQERARRSEGREKVSDFP